MKRGWNSGPSLAVIAVTALLLSATAVSGYTRAEISDEHAFAARVGTALDDARVRTELADLMLTDDPIPAFGSQASVSVERRTGVPRPGELD